jgi:hypothetical protein
MLDQLMQTTLGTSQQLQEVMDLAKQAFAAGPNVSVLGPGVQKAGITTALGITGFDLEGPSKKLFPVLSPLRNRFARKPGAIGSAAVNWKAITGINTAKLKGSVAFGTRNSAITYTEVDKAATYKSIGLDDVVQHEAFWQGRGYEDVRALSAISTLQAMMIEEEKLLLGGNASGAAGIALGTCGNPTVDVSAAGGVTNASGITVKVVPLNLFGYLNRTVDDTTGVTSAIAIATGKGQAGSTADATNITSKKVAATWTAVAGAVAYAIFAGVTGSNVFYLQDVVTCTKWDSGSVALTTSGQAFSALTDADQSQDANDFSGLIAQAFATGSGSYQKNMLAGAFTADNAGGISELDAMLQWFWDKKRIGPSVILVNSQEAMNLTKKIAGSTGAGIGYRVGLNIGADQKNITGGFYVSGYLNKFTSSLTPGSPDIVPFMIHPFLPPGMMIALCERLPYPKADVDAVFVVRTLQEYADFEWAMTQRQYEHGVYAHEVLQCYFTGGIGVIYNTLNG